MPLNTKGAEVGLPSLPNISLGWRILSAPLFLFCLVGLISMMSADLFTVTTIKLTGAQRLNADDILSQLNLSGQSIVSLVPSEIETQLVEGYPSLSEVSVSVSLPAALTIRVQERQPVLVWQQGAVTLWIDSEGILFPPRGEAEIPLTVLAAGDPPGADDNPEEAAESPSAEAGAEPARTPTQTWPRTTPEFVEGVLALSQYVPSGTYLLYDPQFGLGWEDPQGWMVYFGRDISDMHMKLVEYTHIVDALGAEGLTPGLISLEFYHAPYYRMEP